MNILSNRGVKMRAGKIIAAIFLFFIGFIFLIISIGSFFDKEMGIGAGLFLLVIAGLAAWFGMKLIKKPSDEQSEKKSFWKLLSEANKNRAEQKRKERELYQLPQQEFEDSLDNTVFIDYADKTGSFTSRTIEIKKVYERSGELYVDAYCFLKDTDRTFNVNRIFNMRDKYNGRKIKDIEAYFRRKFLKPLSDEESQIKNAKKSSDKKQDVADELRKLKSLLDDGVITQDDFDKKKAQLLGI
jgi:hypothetical protein